MTAKRFWISTSLSTVTCFAIIGVVLKMLISPAPVPTPVPLPSPAPAPLPLPAPEGPTASIAQQKAKLMLSDGRTATFQFAVTGGTLCCTAAVGLDQVLAYDLMPLGDPPPPAPLPTPTPTPNPPAPGPTPPTPSNLRVLFLYDPLTLNDMPPEKQAILASPELRSYLDKHCPLESACASGMCPLTAGKTPSYRFLPTSADVSRLPPVWQQTYRSAAMRTAPWVLATNEAGETVIDQTWPAGVNETLALLKRYGGP